MKWFLIFLGLNIMWGCIGAGMADKRNRDPLSGFLLGFLLGLIGLIIISFVGEKAVERPYRRYERNDSKKPWEP